LFSAVASGLRQDDRELVAPKSRNGVTRAHCATQSMRDLLQQQVTVVMAERIVHVLEAVEVHHQQGQATLVAMRARDRRGKPILEQRAIGEIGEGVVQRLMLQRILPALALGDVLGGANDVHHASSPRVEHWTCFAPQYPQLASARQDAELSPARLPRDERDPPRANAFQVIWMDDRRPATDGVELWQRVAGDSGHGFGDPLARERAVALEPQGEREVRRQL
jgi:hypothetical protein